MVKVGGVFFIKLAIFLCLQGCDFSSQIQNDILEAQDHIYKQEYQEAVDHYEGILLKNPSTQIRFKVLYQLSEIHTIHLGGPQRAIFYLKKILEETNDPIWIVKVKDKLGDLYFSYLHDFTEARRQYQLLLAFKPPLEKSDFYEYRLAQIYMEMGKNEEAIVIWQKIKGTTKHEYYVDSFFYTGMLSFQNQKWQSAISDWSEYLKREKRVDKQFQTKFLMANAYESMEKLDEAYQLYYSLLGKYPNTQVLKNRLKAIHARKLAQKR